MKITLLVDQMPSLISSDPLKISHIVINLLANAIKYSISRSTITITVSGNEKGWWVIEVGNSAEPIPQEKLNTLFKPFVREKSELIEGTGLGLVYCSK